MIPADVRLAITLGDPRGIGPEVTSKALVALGIGNRVTVVGPRGKGSDFAVYEAVTDSGAAPGRAAGLAIERAVEMATRGEVDGIITGPVHKPSFMAAGFAFPGHTEMLKALSGAPEVGMLMCDEGGTGEVDERRPRRVLLATTHIALRDVPAAVTTPLLVSQIRLLGAALMDDFGLKDPRIAVCALNPHASDEGLFGSEEADVFAPAIAAVSGEPWSVAGPIPADTVFVRTFNGEFDAVVSPYHDVGMAAFKTASFGRGVNVTLGLPFIRTSPDHGTAFEIAGRGVADPSSMIEAIRLAGRLAGSRKGLDRGAPAAARGPGT